MNWNASDFITLAGKANQVLELASILMNQLIKIEESKIKAVSETLALEYLDED